MLSEQPSLPPIREHEPLARYTSWRIGGPARFFADAATPEQLRAALAWAAGRGLPLLTLGGGTNMLVRDSGFPGLVLRYRAQELRLEADGDLTRALIGAGAPMAGTARRLARQGYAGLEWAEGLPGTIGGAVYGNAGCYGGEIASSLLRAWLLVGQRVEEWPVERLGYGYRTSVLKHQAGVAQPGAPVVLAAEFRLAPADPGELAARMEQTALARRSKTPSGQSCGSVFKNPPGESAGRLIEAAGLKGTRVGGAEIAQKHANYIVNLGGASSDDVLRLIDLARERVARDTGVQLELEVQLI